MTQSDTPPESLAELIRCPRPERETAFELIDIVDSLGAKTGAKRLEVTLRRVEPEQPQPLPRAETKARVHRFFAVSGFLDYLNRYGCEDTVILADPSKQRIEAVLDERAEFGREVIVFEPQVHPRWEPFRSALGTEFELSELLDFLRDNRRAIEGGRELVFLLSQVTCSTEVKLLKGSGRDSTNGLMVKTSIRGGSEQDTPVQIPESVKVVSPVWVDEPAQALELDLIVGGSRDGTKIHARFASADIREAEIAAFDGVVERIRSEAGERFTVAHGGHRETEWSRVFRSR